MWKKLCRIEEIFFGLWIFLLEDMGVGFLFMLFFILLLLVVFFFIWIDDFVEVDEDEF